jgi:ceramide glucosyltransferase
MATSLLTGAAAEGRGVLLAAGALHALLLAAVAASVVYALGAVRCLDAFRRRAPAPAAFRPPVTVFKPVCGLEAGLYRNLRSFCDQDYPAYQVLFGVQDEGDPAIGIVRRLIAEFPGADIALIIGDAAGAAGGGNPKVGNLGNMHDAARHDFFVIADSDMRVGATWLAEVMAPFGDPGVGAVTCLYKATPVGGLPSRLACMFINEWFFPSVLVSASMREIRFCFGATMAVRRNLLRRIGGFASLSQHLADDHMLGRMVSALGYRVALSRHVVENIVHERSFGHLFRHELRWSRTVRTVEPLGHAFSFLMYGAPLALAAALVARMTGDDGGFGLWLVLSAMTLRVGMRKAARRTLGLPEDRTLWLVPLRDALCLAVWAASFVAPTVHWRGRRFVVEPAGRIAPDKEVLPT